MLVFVILGVLSMPGPVLPSVMDDEPRQIPTPPLSYRFTGYVSSSTFVEVAPGTPFTGVLAYSSVSSPNTLPYALTVTIEGRTFSSADYEIEKHLQVDTLDLIAKQHRMVPQAPGYEGQEFGLRFFASGARWSMLAHAALRSAGKPVREMALSGKIDQFTEFTDEALSKE